jgi:hypothetical protein
LRNRQPEHLGRLEVDDQLEPGRLLDGEIGVLGTFQLKSPPAWAKRRLDAIVGTFARIASRGAAFAA